MQCSHWLFFFVRYSALQGSLIFRLMSSMFISSAFTSSQVLMLIWVLMLICNFSYHIWPYVHKTFEHKFVPLLEKKQPMRTLHQINTLIWLDNFGVQVRKSYSKFVMTVSYKGVTSKHIKYLKMWKQWLIFPVRINNFWSLRVSYYNNINS
jgi:hypothetical protein